MSRNWTPREMYFVDLSIQQRDGHSMRNGLFDMVFVSAHGDKVPFIQEEEKKILSMFKELGFLFSDNLYSLWLSTEEHPRKRKRVLMETEIEIGKIIEADKKQRDLGVFDETLVKWYLGELDSNFYYSDYNNELLQEYLFNKIMK